MEIKINKEILTYQESMFFGLSLRQCLCSAVAVVTAVGIYFGLKSIIGSETTSWVCIVGAAPIAACGFFSYNSLSFEKFVWAYMKSEFLLSGKRVYKSENIYYNLLKESEKNVSCTEKIIGYAQRRLHGTEKRSEVDTD